MADLNPERQKTFVVIAAAGTLQRADVIRTILELNDIHAIIPGEYATNMLSHISLGLNPNGVRVAVSSDDEQKARAILERKHRVGPDIDYWPKAQPEETTPEEFARRAVWAGLISWFFPFILPAALYDLVKAFKTAGPGLCEVRVPKLYKRRMVVAFLLALPLAAIFIVLVLYGSYELLAALVGAEGY